MAKSSKEIIAAFVMDFERRRQAALRERLITVCQRQVRRIEEDMSRIAGRYGLHAGQEMQLLHGDGRFQDGDSRRDLRRVEEMQAQLDRLVAFLQALQNAATLTSG